MPSPEELLPGKELEKAAAEVATDAGKSLVRGIGRTLGALTAEWTAKKEAKADAARKAIDTQGDIDRANALTDARRSSEISEVDHQQRLEFAKRRAERMLHEMAREQENLESITKKALSLIESEPADSQAADVDEEWLFRFAKFAEGVSDEVLQDIWARVLRSASVRGMKKLSAASLLQLSLIDNSAAADFEKFCKVYKSFGIFPAHERFYDESALGINVRVLEELGLIQHAQPTSLQLNDAILELGQERPSLGLKLFHQAFTFTYRGAEIANAVIGHSELDDGQQDAHLNDVVGQMLASYETVLVMPRGGSNYAIIHQAAAIEGIAKDLLQVQLQNGDFSDRMSRLLIWAADKYSISLHPISNFEPPQHAM